MAGARPQPTQKLFEMANQMKVVTYVGDITSISDASGVVTGEGLEFEHESFVTRALIEDSSEFAMKREELKGKARRFKSWSVHTTKLSEPSPFSYVFHAVIKSPVHTNRWVKKMEDLYKKIMKKAEKYEVKVLAIPLLGTGETCVLILYFIDDYYRSIHVSILCTEMMCRCSLAYISMIM